MKKKFRRKILLIFLIISLIGLLIPQNLIIPVEGVDKNDWNPKTFWYYPWGKSVTHKGVDVFAKEGTNVISSVNGIVLYSGEINLGGNVILILGPKWRVHYYAHLNNIKTSGSKLVKRGTSIGSVGTSGNAAGKAPHLHYSIITLIPYPWRIDNDKQGW